MATKVTYTEVTNREDLSDMITNISPYDTPVYSMIGKTKAKAVKHEWPEDELSPPQANAQIEGFTYDPAAAPNRTRLDNVTQIMSRGYSVSGTQQAVDKAGVTDEIAYNMHKAMKTIALDVERAYLLNTASVAGSATVARQMAGLPGFITTNVVSTTGVLTEDVFNDAMQMQWQAGGDVKDVIMSGANKRAITNWTAPSNRQLNAQDKKFVSVIDVYESTFGLVKLHASRWVSDDTVFGLSKEYVKTATLRSFKTEQLPKSSDALAEMIIGELTLECRAEKAHFIISGIVPA